MGTDTRSVDIGAVLRTCFHKGFQRRPQQYRQAIAGPAEYVIDFNRRQSSGLSRAETLKPAIIRR
ncbi:hypothetical protein GCM10022403_045450 [Streptomyces coacervatus]|uniref:Transposase n=1 Tax=Streptomyces coacervatus TaxID=647381 RepID=A0ABP7I113_9ACTN